jgi:hypothetical protein
LECGDLSPLLRAVFKVAPLKAVVLKGGNIVSGLFEGAKKAKEKAASKTSELKVQVVEHAAETKELGFAKLAALVQEINGAVPALREAGYRMEMVNIKLGVSPAVTVMFASAGDVSEKKINALVEANAERRMTVLLAKSLVQARKLQSKVKMAGLEPLGISVDVGLFPEIGLRFGRPTDAALAKAITGELTENKP